MIVTIWYKTERFATMLQLSITPTVVSFLIYQNLLKIPVKSSLIAMALLRTLSR